MWLRPIALPANRAPLRHLHLTAHTEQWRSVRPHELDFELLPLPGLAQVGLQGQDEVHLWVDMRELGCVDDLKYAHDIQLPVRCDVRVVGQNS